MTETAQIDNLAYTLKLSQRNSLGITIERDGAVIVRAPIDLDHEEIERFVSEKRLWIQQKLAKKFSVMGERPKREFVNGQGFLYLGKSYRLRYVENSSEVKKPKDKQLHLRHGYFELDIKQKPNARNHFISWYKEKTQDKLRERIPRYDRRIGVQVQSFGVSNLGHRWASYSRNGTIHFNWRSIMAPIWVFDYILVHEMAHMVERRHSKRFWQLVSRVMPDYGEHDRWLAENGPELEL
jgi:hypothetical protein